MLSRFSALLIYVVAGLVISAAATPMGPPPDYNEEPKYRPAPYHPNSYSPHHKYAQEKPYSKYYDHKYGAYTPRDDQPYSKSYPEAKPYEEKKPEEKKYPEAKQYEEKKPEEKKYPEAKQNPEEKYEEKKYPEEKKYEEKKYPEEKPHPKPYMDDKKYPDKLSEDRGHNDRDNDRDNDRYNDRNDRDNDRKDNDNGRKYNDNGRNDRDNNRKDKDNYRKVDDDKDFESDYDHGRHGNSYDNKNGSCNVEDQHCCDQVNNVRHHHGQLYPTVDTHF